MTPARPSNPSIVEPTPPARAVDLRPRAALDHRELTDLNDRFETASASEIVSWAVERFGSRLAMTASFADTVLIDVAVAIDPDIEVVFLDTGFHFAETLATVRRTMERHAINLTVLRPDGARPDVWGAGVDTCCDARKSEPLDRHFSSSVDAWMSGLRRADSDQRAATPIVSIDRRGLVKVNPLATMTDEAVARYIDAHDVIVNPLLDEGYASIGCWPCTEPVVEGRDGRWAGTAKTECGLHR